MAQTKKSTTKKTTAAKKTVAKKAPAKKPTQKKTAAVKAAAAQAAVKRRNSVIIGAIFLFLSLIGFLAFGLEGFFITWYRTAFFGLLGGGAYAMPFALCFGGLALILVKKDRSRLRAAALMLMPLVIGCLFHLSVDDGGYSLSVDIIKGFGTTGLEGASGGIFCGLFAHFMRSAISHIGAIIFFTLILILCFFLAIDMSPKKLANKLSELIPEEGEYDDDDDIDIPVMKRPPPVKKPAARRTPRSAIDIPIDEDDDIVKLTEESMEIPSAIFAGRSGEGTDLVKAEDIADTFDDIGTSLAGEAAAPAVLMERRLEAEDAAPWDDEEEPEELTLEQVLQTAIENVPGADYVFPSVTLLKPGSGKPAGTEDSTRECAVKLLDTLKSFGVDAQIVDITVGPAVTRYELQLNRGIKVSKVTNLADDIALALGVSGVRVSTIPNKNAVGIEAPNTHQELVTAKDIITSPAFKRSQSKLSFAVGKDITGECIIGDIGKMPHMLIAGTTGSGKSVCINSILISILYKASPDEVRLIMIDPKMIELGVYNGIPHLLIPVVTDPKKAAGALNWAVMEMLRRYKLIAEVGARDLANYNKEVRGQEDKEILPQIVIVIDELSDLMVAAKSEVEEAIIRLAQMARAAGMHLIIATQRPSADVITGLMKTNIPSRIAFSVSSQIDSRIILDQGGAEKLLGRGDMLYSPIGSSKPQRIQGCFVTDKEVEDVVSFVKKCGDADYSEEIINHIEKQAEAAGAAELAGGADDEEDELLTKAIEVAVEAGQVSVSMLQRRLKLGYARAARLVDQMEERGIVGPYEGAKPRSVLISRDDWKEMMLRRSQY